MESQKRILVVLHDIGTSQQIEKKILSSESYNVIVCRTCQAAEEAAHSIRLDLMILGDDLPDGDYLELACRLLQNQPTLPIILLTRSQSDKQLRKAFPLGLVDCLSLPFQAEDMRNAIKRALDRRKHWRQWLIQEDRLETGELHKQVKELETLAKASRAVTAKLDLDAVLKTVIDAAVELTKADTGSILLLDQDSGELFMRASRNFQEEYVRTFRLPAKDSLAGEVLRSGEPLFIQNQDIHKIKTSYLVSSLIYVPLNLEGKVIGVLGVDNRESVKSFEPHAVSLLSALADYAAVAINKAQLYSQTELERNKLEQVLTQVQDGVIVCDDEGRILLLNHKVRTAFALGDQNYSGKKIEKVISDVQFRKAIEGKISPPEYIEIKGKDDRTYNISITNIPDVGLVTTLHDISYLKELDNVKTDFINTVSHDLRSPLTSILGYVELIERGSGITEQQKEYIHRIRLSVQNITNLIDGLLNLGRIDMISDKDVKLVDLSEVIKQTLFELQGQIDQRKQKVALNLEPKLPPVRSKQWQLKQVVDNLLGNAVKYSPVGGAVGIKVSTEEGQIIFEVTDSGPGIPKEEHAKIFDKFYRAKNVSPEVPGTGLGLAICKNIVDNLNGRIWVDSQEGKGSTFFVVFPVAGK